MTEQHPITPPPELVQQWSDARPHGQSVLDNWLAIAAKAARWGADTELEACCAFLEDDNPGGFWSGRLRAARRPKPPSLKELALAEMEMLESHGVHACCLGTLRRALESLDD